jgi:seryl-tRNA synthetase
MMMEEEIERTKEEINGIEEACEKVEKVLENVILQTPNPPLP